jgi:hypothetical protein
MCATPWSASARMTISAPVIVSAIVGSMENGPSLEPAAHGKLGA